MVIDELLTLFLCFQSGDFPFQRVELDRLIDIERTIFDFDLRRQCASFGGLGSLALPDFCTRGLDRFPITPIRL